MEKIVTHPIFKKCKKVYESCQTFNQFIVAKEFDFLCRSHIQKGYYKGLARKVRKVYFVYDINQYFDNIQEKTKNRLERLDKGKQQ